MATPVKDEKNNSDLRKWGELRGKDHVDVELNNNSDILKGLSYLVLQLFFLAF